MEYTSIIGEQKDQRFSLQELAHIICSSMASRKSLLLEHTFLNCKMQLRFKNSINLSRIKSVTSVLAQLSGTLKHIVFELSVGLNDGEVGEQLTVLMQRPNNEISSLLLLNQMSLRPEEGKFMFAHGKGFILKADLSFLRYCRDSRRLKVYLNQKIQKIYSLFSRELQRILVFLRGKGEGSTSKGLIEQKEKLIMLTQVLQKHRQFRPKSTKINLSGCIQKTTAELLDLDFKPLRTKKITHSQLLQSEQVFDQKAQEIMKASKESSSLILQGMRIKSVCKPETAMCEGGFSKISRGIFDIQLFGSVNQESVGIVEQRQYFALVVKQHKKIEDYHALLNQQRFLVFARNNRCSHIGQYYSQTKNSSYFQNGIYLQHYPNTLAQNIYLNQRQTLNIMTEVAQGLSFLNDIGVAHRDIKLHNIMVDRQRRAKIIDFGSAAPIIWTEKCKFSAFVAEKDTRLTSTEGYYLPYRQAALKCVSLGDKFTREQYECHQNFDIYSFGVVLTKKMCLNLPCVGDYLRQQLLLMSRKCLQPNPDDRITAIEVAAWLKCLEQYEWQRRCVWNYAQRKARELQRNEIKQ